MLVSQSYHNQSSISLQRRIDKNTRLIDGRSRPKWQKEFYSDRLQIVSHVPFSFGYRFNHGFDVIENNGDRWVTLPKKVYLSVPAIFEKWADPSVIVGLRFGKETNYGLIDIDTDSPYHCEEGLSLIKEGLEAIGINDTLLIQSSFSGGYHLYFFLPFAVATFSLATAIAVAMKEQGLTIDKGILEIFPNTKSYDKNGFTRYNGHRLPLQEGSYLLDDDLQPYSNSLDTFLSQADQCALSVDPDVLLEALEKGPERWKELNKIIPLAGFLSKKHSKKGKAWKNALLATIEQGWTGFSQSNDLLGIIAIHGRVFEGLAGQDLANYIEATAIACPGYYEYCRHQNEIKAWSIRWARCAEKKYYPYGTKKGEFKPLGKGGLTNEEKKADAYQRIIEAVEDLTITGKLPEKMSDRRRLISQCAKCSERTLAKAEYLPLWHPKHQNGAITVIENNTEDKESLDHTLLLTVCIGNEAEKNPQSDLSNVIEAIAENQNGNENEKQESIQESNLIPLFSSSVLPATAQKVMKTSQVLDMQAFKARQCTNADSQSVLPIESAQSPKVYQHNPQRFESWTDESGQVFRVGDRVIEIARPREVLTIVEIQNDGWMRCQDDWGISLYHVSELILDEF